MVRAPFDVDPTRAQNLCHDLRETAYRPEAAAPPAVRELFRSLAAALSLRVDPDGI